MKKKTSSSAAAVVLPPISEMIWDMKYRYRRNDVVVDQTVADSWHRVARAVAAHEKNPGDWEKKFYALLEDFRFLPGGRILANAGTGRRQTTMFNCYVMGTIEDSIEGIFQTVKEAAQTQKQGGGVGFDFSPIRPRNSFIKGVDSPASGPLSFMQVLDATCRTIMSAGQRRGAQMGIMRCDHPDIEAFIAAKREEGMLRMFNLSVAVTDEFLAAVAKDADWPLVHGGKTWKTIKAKELWDKIMRSTYDFAEPGIFMVDRVNAMNNLWYCETIAATNPCVTADSWVQTDAGPRQVAELLGKPFQALVDGELYQSGKKGFYATGTKPVLKLTTKEGYTLRLTAEHPVAKVGKQAADGSQEGSWTPVAELQAGDKIVLNNHRTAELWEGEGSFEAGYETGLNLQGKAVTPDMERGSADFVCGLLGGLFAGARLQGTKPADLTVRLSLADKTALPAVQRMLLRIGVASVISTNKPTPELIIRKDNIVVFAAEIGLAEPDASTKLTDFLDAHGEDLAEEPFTAEVATVTPDGTEEVYDVEVSDVHAFDANGIMVHNCAEQPLPPYGACLLGSLNLTRFVQQPFTPDAAFDFAALEKYAKLAVRFLDNVIELSNFPLPQQAEEARKKRRMGIGLTGLADTLVFLGLRYGSPESLAFAGKAMRAITFATYEASCDLAAEKGAFPLFDAEKYLQGKFTAQLPAPLRAKIRKQGLRNSHLTSIAPTGTISLLAGNISSGIEPIFAYHYIRKVRNGDEGNVSEYEVMDYAYAEYCRIAGRPADDQALPPAFTHADGVTPEQHLDMQAAIQQYVDSSISKTINVPAEFPFEAFKDIYLKAYQKGLKGCTTFRPSEFITGVLVKKEDKKHAKAKHPHTTTPDRPVELVGTTYKVRTPASKDAFYVTINDIEENGERRPYEIFINTKNLQHFSWIVAMTRTISAIFRREPNPSFLVEELSSVYDPAGGYFNDGEYVPSLPAEIGRVIATHLRNLGIMPEAAGGKHSKKHGHAHHDPHVAEEIKTAEEKAGAGAGFCPSCNQPKLIASEGCLKCLACGYSKCG